MKQPFYAPESYQIGDLTVRMYRKGDAVALQRAVLASHEHLRPWMPWAKRDYSLDDAESVCRRTIARYLTNEEFGLGAWIDDEFVGGTGFHLRWGDLGGGVAEIGMWISASRAGSGLGTRLLRAMLAWGFGEWGWERLAWKCDTRNHASARVAEKCGLVREATLRSDALDADGSRRDTHLYAILKSEYRA